MEKLTTEKEYQIYYYDIDYKKKVLPTSIMNYFSDVALEQCSLLNMDLDYMFKNNITWVLYKWDITIKRYPLIGEKITVSTTPYAFRKFYAYRKYDIKDSNGNVIVTANSVWFLLNIEKRRPMRITENMYDAFHITEDDNKELPIEKILPITRIDSEKEFNIRYSDIDTNMHVNNVKYAAWVLETVPLDIVKGYTLNKIIMTYEKETTYGEMIRVQTQIIENGNQIVCVHRILDKEYKELNQAQTTWIKD